MAQKKKLDGHPVPSAYFSVYGDDGQQQWE